MAQQDAWRAYYELALGLTETSRKKAMKIAQRVAGKGGATAEQLQALADDLVSAGAANREAMARMIKVELDRTLGRVGLATMDEVNDLTQRVHELERELRATGSGASDTPTTVESATKAAKNAEVEKAAVKSALAKKTVEKKAVAKKAVATKTAAAQPVATPPVADKPVATETAPAKTAPAKTAPTKTAPAKSAPAKTVPAKSAPAKSASTKAAPAKTTAKKAPAKKTAVAKTTAKKTTAKSTAKKANPQAATGTRNGGPS